MLCVEICNGWAQEADAQDAKRLSRDAPPLLRRPHPLGLAALSGTSAARGADIDLKNRFLRIGFEYGSKTADSVAGLHRRLPTEDRKLPIDVEKLPIRAPTKRHLLLLWQKFGAAGEAFGPAQVVEAVGVKDRAARNLISLMRANGVVVGARGCGKGKVLFASVRKGG